MDDIEYPPLLPEVAWNAFYLHALLVHKGRIPLLPQQSSTIDHLELPHHGDNRDRLLNALEDRNQIMAGTGQEQWAHACDDCEKITRPTEGSPLDTPWSEQFLS